MNSNLDSQSYSVDVCVVGGGMAGLIAAVSAARRGASVVLIHDRPVLGGNASSEVRMWICGAHGPDKKESGLLEEIQLKNLHRNPDGLYSHWDSVLFEFAKMTPGLTTLLNCSCNDAEMDGPRIRSVNAWQLTTQSWHRVEAKMFIDCSGDSILAPLSGAETRHGRESREEFGEPIAPLRSDLKTMGNTTLLQIEETAKPQSFTPPSWAYYFDEDSTLPSRLGSGIGHNFWWLEIGGLADTIRDAENIRDELIKAAWGVWDYMKNRAPQAERLKNWRLRWLGALPGKRENRRYLGDHIMTQHDVDAGGPFEDIIAYGGWSMDDHHPAGLYYPGKATIFHPAPSPYGIPFRSLYSRNIENLLCAGRNISATHAALSSTRVMATCAIMGQAVGTAAALCVRKSIRPTDVSGESLQELQRQLMEDDCWLPGKAKPTPGLTREAKLESNGETSVELLTDGHERKIEDSDHAWSGRPGSHISLNWDQARRVECLRLVFDSDLSDRKTMPCRYALDAKPFKLPKSLVKAFKLEAQSANGHWETLYETDENIRRLVVLPVKKEVTAIRWTGLDTWGAETLRVFSIEAHETALPPSEDPPKGISWNDVVANLPAEDLAEPDHGLENVEPSSSRVGA